MDIQNIIEAMAEQHILETDLSGGPTAVIIRQGTGRPKCIVVRAEGRDFTIDVPGFFSSKKVKVAREEVEKQAEKARRLQEFMKEQEE